ncbi:MAG TPA: hypothetical protein VH878_05625, partial [Thermodesulfobacteriota bacterium]
MADSTHSIFDSCKRVILKLISKVFPFKGAQILFLDKLEIPFVKAKINQIKIRSISSPHITSDLCPVRSKIIELNLSFEDQGSQDLFRCLKEGLSRSQIEDLDLRFDGSELILDKLEMTFEEAKINQINIPSTSLPHINSDLCPVRPELVELSPFLKEQKLKDLSIYLKEGMSWLQTEALDFWFDRPELCELKTPFEKVGIDTLDLTTRFEVERQKEEEEHPKAEAESKRVEPEKRGGRPRFLIQERGKQQGQEPKPHRSKPEIVCWKRERQWILAVEVPEELLGNSGLVVLQNATPLTQDKSSEGCWCLEQAYGQIVVCWNEDEVAKEIDIELEENYLLFKVSVQNQGHHVKSPSSGSYLMVVPENWERDNSLSGPP